MADVIVVGGGVGGLTTAMLARDGHRAAAGAGSTPTASRPRGLLGGGSAASASSACCPVPPRWRQTVEAELPSYRRARSRGALRFNTVADVPAEISSGLRPGDERFEMVTGRRPVVEAVLAGPPPARPASPSSGAWRGPAAMADRPPLPGIPHVTGVETEDGRLLHADLVVDAAAGALPSAAGWRRWAARRPSWRRRTAAGCTTGATSALWTGRSACVRAALQPYDSISLLTLAADNGTWGVGIVTSAADPALRAARHEETWARIVKNYPLVAHWLEVSPSPRASMSWPSWRTATAASGGTGRRRSPGSWRSVTPGPAPIRRRAGAPPSPASTPCARATCSERCRPPTRWGWRGASIRRRSTRWSRSTATPSLGPPSTGRDRRPDRGPAV